MIFPRAVGALDDGTPSFATQTTPLLNKTKMTFGKKVQNLPQSNADEVLC